MLGHVRDRETHNGERTDAIRGHKKQEDRSVLEDHRSQKGQEKEEGQRRWQKEKRKEVKLYSYMFKHYA